MSINAFCNKNENSKLCAQQTGFMCSQCRLKKIEMCKSYQS